MVQLNKSRTNYYERFQRLIDAYNADSENVELYLHELMAFTRNLNQEDQRHISEQLSEEELAMFDLLLDSLPPSYTQEVYLQLCTDVFQHVYESYFGQGKSVDALAS